MHSHIEQTKACFRHKSEASFTNERMYHKNPKISDTQNICCNHPKNEQDDFSLE